MTIKSAVDWPRGFAQRLDSFATSSVRGQSFAYKPSTTSSGSVSSGAAVSGSYAEYSKKIRLPFAGVKPTDVIVKKYTTSSPNNKKYYYWVNITTGEVYESDPRPPGKPQAAPPPANMTFVKTRWIGLTFPSGLGSPYGGSPPIAYQLWVVQGTAINEEDASNAYVRRGGAFSVSGGNEWFQTFVSMQGSGQRYAPRKIGLAYRNDAEILQYQTELVTKYGQDFFQEINRLNASNFDWTNSFYGGGAGGNGSDGAGIYGADWWGATIGADILVNGLVTTGTGGGSGRGSRGRDSGVPAPPELPIPAITITTRMPKGYVGRGSPRGAKPQMVQRYQFETTNADGDTVIEYADDIHFFRYVPQGIKYSGLSGQWVEVPRAEDIPFVDWASWQLMKVSFSFIVADERTEPGGAIVPDGLEISVDGQIEQLRRMAQRKVPVTLVNFDEMLTFQLRRGSLRNNGTEAPQPNMEFVITDFSVTATRRTAVPATGGSSSPSLIAVAQCEITLTEIPVETVGIIALPPITTPGLPPSTKKPPGTNGQRYEYITDIMASPDRAYNSYLPNDNI